MVVLDFETHWLVHYDVFLPVLESEDFHLAEPTGKTNTRDILGPRNDRRNENLREWRVNESRLERPQQHGSNPSYMAPTPVSGVPPLPLIHQAKVEMPAPKASKLRENSTGWSQLSWPGQRVSPNWLLWSWYELISIRFIIQTPCSNSCQFMFITSSQGLWAWNKSTLPACHPCAWEYESECVRQVRIDCIIKVIHVQLGGKESIGKSGC